MAKATSESLTVREVAVKQRKDPKTVWRWVKYGLPMPNGSVVRLAATKVGREWRISLADLTEFSRQLTESALQPAA